MHEEMIDVRPPDGKAFQTFVADDAPASRKPAIVLFTPVFGINDDMKGIARRWAQRGYLVALPDYFFRVRPGVIERTSEGRELAMDRWKKLDVNQTVNDMGSLAKHLQALPACNGAILAIGFCAGGEVAFLGAVRLGFDAIATFHATHIHRHLDEAANVKARMTLHYGDKDSLVPLEQVDAIRARFAGNPRVDVHVHAGAEHSFTIPTVPAYHEAAATASDRRAEEVFRQYQSAA